jgi:hypothetical protein
MRDGRERNQHAPVYSSPRMDSTRPIPFQAAAAYGMKPKANTPATSTSSRVGGVITPPAARPPNTANLVTGMVSGKVDSPVSRGLGFDPGAGSPADARRRAALSAATGALQMYSRAADRVEVATAAQLGRILDTRG